MNYKYQLNKEYEAFKNFLLNIKPLGYNIKNNLYYSTFPILKIL